MRQALCLNRSCWSNCENRSIVGLLVINKCWAERSCLINVEKLFKTLEKDISTGFQISDESFRFQKNWKFSIHYFVIHAKFCRLVCLLHNYRDSVTSTHTHTHTSLRAFLIISTSPVAEELKLSRIPNVWHAMKICVILKEERHADRKKYGGIRLSERR